MTVFLIDDIIMIAGYAVLGGAIGGAVGGIFGYVIACIIDEDSIKDVATKNNDNAFKLLIKQKKTKAVKVGIFDDKDDIIEDVEIKSEKGVSSSIYEGQVIYV